MISVAITSLLVAAAQAAQPSSPSPVAAPLRELQWGDLNILHTTDTHGWHAGHLLEPSYSADWGDFISFASHMRDRAEKDGKDLIVVDTGDRVEGNGLYDASKPQGNYTRDIFKHQHYDIITSGNHELYRKNTSENEYLDMVPLYKDSYLASNIDVISPKDGTRVPLARRYKKFTTNVQGIRVLAFGFLFDFTGNYNNTIVQPVKDTIKEQWFQDAIHDREVDVFVVAGHVAIRSDEYDAIYKAIRDVQWDAPIMFLGGHTHIRDYKKYDSKSYALESGRYMETIGFQSISGLSTSNGKPQSASLTFARRYIDNNLFSFHHHTSLNSSTFPTPLGKNVSDLITQSRTALKLDKKFGCAPHDLWASRVPYPGESSIFSWLDSRVLPDVIVDPDRASKARIILINTGGIRFDIFKGAFTKDSTFIVSPFRNVFRYIKDVPFPIADQVLTLLNNAGPILEQAFPDLKAAELGQPRKHENEVSIDRFDTMQHNLASKQTPLRDEPKLIPGYTTKDDAGDDGDDTIHSKISFYSVPNCIEARVNTTTKSNNGDEQPVATVDLVYIEFIQPWILRALQFLGADKLNDTQEYLAGQDFTTLMTEWISNNWDGEC